MAAQKKPCRGSNVPCAAYDTHMTLDPRTIPRPYILEQSLDLTSYSNPNLEGSNVPCSAHETRMIAGACKQDDDMHVAARKDDVHARMSFAACSCPHASQPCSRRTHLAPYVEGARHECSSQESRM